MFKQNFNSFLENPETPLSAYVNSSIGNLLLSLYEDIFKTQKPPETSNHANPSNDASEESKTHSPNLTDLQSAFKSIEANYSAWHKEKTKNELNSNPCNIKSFLETIKQQTHGLLTRFTIYKKDNTKEDYTITSEEILALVWSALHDTNKYAEKDRTKKPRKNEKKFCLLV